MANNEDYSAAKAAAEKIKEVGYSGSPLIFPESATKNHWIMFRPYKPEKHIEPKASSTTSQKDEDATSVVKYRSGQPIYLYHPDNSFQANTTANWEETETGLIGSLINLVTDPSIDKLKDAATRGAFQFAAGGTAAQIISKRTGQIINPNLDLFFKGIGFREFSFSYLLAPENEKEMKTMMEIVRNFKKNAVPETQSDGWMTYPAYWEIEAKSRGTIIHRFKKCACTQVNVDSTPNQLWASFKSGEPVAIKLDLTFKETELITSKDYEKDENGWY